MDFGLEPQLKGYLRDAIKGKRKTSQKAAEQSI
jgi:hypothetical protein